ncbi:UNVERIFIED_CONTAM: hypothetical protein GTU68_034083, partial [Idotea baltica]|nr:hypothetical protein [Idotea baltica]
RIVVRGARRTTTCRGVDLELPRDITCCVTGLSGSGKSSLAFEHDLRRRPAPLRANHCRAYRPPSFLARWTAGRRFHRRSFALPSRSTKKSASRNPR